MGVNVMKRYVIIGNGVAGISAAETIRSLDPDGSITIIARERFPPYSRPMISLVLQGSVPLEQLLIRSPQFYSELRAEALVGESVTAIDVPSKTVLTDSGSRVPYDRLLIATGANPRKAKAAGRDLPGVSVMRTEEDVRGILSNLAQASHALVVGGGLVGFKAAYGLLHRGVGVTMVIRSGYPLSMQVDPQAGALILKELQANGLKVVVGADVASFEGNGRLREACLSNGTAVRCEIAVVGKGVMPVVDFLPKNLVKTDLGIVVDDHLRSSVQDIFAAGDCCQARDVVRGETWVNAVWPVAVEQGRLVGMNMAGRSVSYRGSLGRNVIRVFGMDVLTAGIVNPPDGCTVIQQEDGLGRHYRKLVLRDDVLVGFVSVGNIEQGGVLISLMQRGMPLTVEPGALLSRSFNFGTLLP